MSGSTSISIARGAALTVEVSLIDKKTGEALPLSGRHVEMCVVKKLGADDEILALSTENPSEGAVTSEVGGTCEFYLLSTVTEDIAPGSYRWDVWVIEDADHEYPALIGGTFSVTERGCVMPGGS